MSVNIWGGIQLPWMFIFIKLSQFYVQRRWAATSYPCDQPKIYILIWKKMKLHLIFFFLLWQIHVVMKNVFMIFKCFGASLTVIAVSAYDMSFLVVSAMFLFRRLQSENAVYLWGRSHIEETEPALEKTQYIRLYRTTGKEQDFNI